MSNVVNLAEYKTEKQYKQFYCENLDLSLDIHYTYPKQKQSKEEIDREMRLGYMRILTEAIEKNRKCQ